MTIRRIVKCPECSKIKVTYANRDFKCCGKHWDIEKNLIEGGSEPKNSGLEKSGNLTTFRVSKGEVATTLKQSNVENAGSNPELADLKFEEEEHNNPIENLNKEEKKEFKCPNCGNKLNEYQTPCPQCLYEIEWQ